MSTIQDLAAPVTVRSRARPRSAAGDAGTQRLPAALQTLIGNPRLTVGGAIILLVSVLAIAAPWVVQHAPDAQNPVYRLAAPSWSYPLGGDSYGRDTFSRLLYAGRVSLAVGVLSMVITVVIGVAVGALAGYCGGWVDRILMRLTDLVLVFPTFFLLILVVATFGRSVSLLIFMIGITSWPTNARVVRGQILALREEDYVTAARVNGGTAAWVVVRHLLPQLIPIVIASATIRVANNILVESGLSYLGLGVQPPTATWGNMVTDGVAFIRQAWWLVGIPGAAIFVVVLAFNLFGEGLRDQLDPRWRASR